MKSKGKYHFGRHRRLWGIWDDQGIFLKDVFSYEEAVREVYKLNGWGEPKHIKQS